MNFKEMLGKKSAEVEKYLSDCLDKCAMPEGLQKAMNYSLLAGGKRLRPVLCLEWAKVGGAASRQAVMPFAAAIECIHTYSLIHDDLPAMDDDDLRRGKPSNHKAFDEATAILAGDALLTDAFMFMTSVGLKSEEPLAANRVLEAINQIAWAAGSSGMVGGQFLDMQYTARSDVDLEMLRGMQERKTGALIVGSCTSGALLGGDTALAAKAAQYGRGLGAAFQIVDDILDETGDESVLGKPVGSDAEQGKVTYPSLVGLEKSRELARSSANMALRALEGLEGEPVEFLRELVDYVLKRAS